MDSEIGWQRVPYPEHPDRCQANRGNQGQCINIRVMQPEPGSQYCAAHGGNRAPQEAAKRELAAYRANSYLQKFKPETDDLINLHAEVMLIKQLIEEKQSLIQDAHSCAMYSPQITDMLMKAEKLVNSAARLNDKLGMSMNAQQAMAFATDVLQIISEEVTDGVKHAAIQARIMDSITRRSDSVLGREPSE